MNPSISCFIRVESHKALYCGKCTGFRYSTSVPIRVFRRVTIDCDAFTRPISAYPGLLPAGSDERTLARETYFVAIRYSVARRPELAEVAVV